MRTHTTGWEECGQAPARVEAAHQSIVACDGTGESHDKPPAAPMAQLPVASWAQASLALPPDAAGTAQNL